MRESEAEQAAKAPLVLHLVTDLRVGGTQTILLERVRRGGPFRHAVLCLAVRTGARRSGGADLAADFAAVGVQVHALGLATPAEAVRALLRGELTARTGEILARMHPSILHSTLFHTHVLGAWMARRSGVPHLASKEGTDDWMRPAHRLLEARSLRGAQRVIAVSEAVAEVVRRLGVPASRVVIIPNGIDPARPGRWRVPPPGWIEPARRVTEGRAAASGGGGESDSGRASDSGGPHLLGVGRLDPVKGWDDLLAALALLQTTHPNVHLDLLGSGSDAARDRLRARAKSLGLADRVRIDGGPTAPAPVTVPIPAERTPRPILVVPSREEGFGLVLLEGMARGLPIVATQVGGIPGVARPDEEAILVPPRDPHALARAIARVHDDPALADRLVRNGLVRVRAFPADAMVDAYDRLYAGVIEGAITGVIAGAAGRRP